MSPSTSNAAVFAGIAGFVLVFAAGFALGTVRVLVMVPLVGPVWATVLELPVILALAWVACSVSIGWFAVAARWPERLLMGAVAFACLITAETLLGMAGFDRTLTEQLAVYRQTGPALGLLAQIVFASFPLLQLRFGPPPAST